jgi:Subtilase family
MPYEHLRLSREEPLRDRHRRRDTRPRFAPTDPRAFGATLLQRFVADSERNRTADIGGFDQRRLLKIKLRHGERALPAFDKFPGIEIVSQEADTLVLAFATDEGLRNFERRLATLARDGEATRKELLYVIEDFDRWTPEDRTGPALRDQGLPHTETFMLDVELWPLENTQQRNQLVASIARWMQERGIQILDRLAQPSLVMLRLRCSRDQADLLLQHRDVRTVDLPPRLGVSVEMLVADVNQFPPVEGPPGDSPKLAVLDSGLASGHSLLGPAVGDSQGFVEPERNVVDNVPNGHGTFVAGLGLYGDVAECIRAGRFVPALRLFAGKVFNDDDADQTEFVERAVDEAVRCFVEQYGCKVFNLSYGDRNKVYAGGHVRGLAYTLDRLSRDLGVLFVVPTGNLLPGELPADPRAEYPTYLFEPKSRLLDPAPVLSALTVGGLAHNTATAGAQLHEETIEELPIAHSGQPAPFTRAGPSVGGAIKPDLVDEAGNWAVRRLGGVASHRGLGIVSTNSGFAGGRSFSEGFGTSFAAPRVARVAALVAGRVPDATGNLLRAVLAAHARWPQASVQLLAPHNTQDERKRLMQLIGYGQVDQRAVLESLDDVVTLLSEDRIGNDQHHFYEIPVPEEFWQGRRRTKRVSVALAYCPEVRTTRLDYRRSKISFTLVTAESLDEVTRAFRRGRGRDEGMPERATNRLIPNNERKAGTLQMSRWEFGTALRGDQKLFVVVTRQDAPWPLPQDADEPYAIAAVLDDSENVHIELYQLVRERLEARIQLRARIRA